METILKVEYPFKRTPRHRWKPGLSRRWKLSWLFQWGFSSIQEFGGSKVNTVHHLSLFCRHVLTIHCNEYHDCSDAERANEYLKAWSECEKELQGLRLIVLGDSTGAEVKKVIREAFRIDLDEGRIL